MLGRLIPRNKIQRNATRTILNFSVIRGGLDLRNACPWRGSSYLVAGFVRRSSNDSGWWHPCCLRLQKQKHSSTGIYTLRCFSKETELKQNSAGFVESWIAMKERLISRKHGSLKSMHWMEAERLINVVRTHPDLASVPNRVEIMFEVLDRLCDELDSIISMDKGKSRSKLKKRETDESTPNSLPQVILYDTLLAWLKQISTSMESKTRSGIVREKQHRGRYWPSATPPTFLRGRLSTDSVLESIERYNDVGLFQPSTRPYSIVLHAMNKVGDPRRAPYRADEIFQHLLQKSNHDPFDTKFHPNRDIVYGMIEIWAQSWLPESCERVEGYLKLLKEWFGQTKREDHRPNPSIFCASMEAHARSNETRAAFCRIKQLFSEMKSNCPASEVDRKALNRVIYAFSECDHPESPDVAGAMLRDMCESIYDETNNIPNPDQHTFNTVLSTYGRAGRADAAAELFEYMEQLYERTGDVSLRPNKITRTALIWAFAKVGDKKRAESVLLRMIDDLGQDTAGFRSWEGVLVAWSESGDPGAGRYIAMIIQRLLKAFGEKNDPGRGITTSTLNILLSCYAQQASEEGAKMAESLFDWMETQTNHVLKPDRYSCLQLISAWCNANMPQRAENVLRAFVRRVSVDQSLIDQTHFNLVIEAWGQSKYTKAVQKASAIFNLIESLNLRPDVVSYNCLMTAWGRSKMGDSAKPVIRLFDRMTKQWKEGDPFAKPDQQILNAVIFGLGRSSNQTSLSQAEAIFDTAEEFDIKRNFFMYNSLMSGWMRQKQPEKVEELFQEMKRGFEKGEGNLKPDPKTHVTRLQAWSKAGNPEMATEALNEWISIGEAESFDNMPGTQAFNSILVAWNNSGRSDAAKKAEMGLRQMFELADSGRFDCRPDRFAFSIVISAYAKSDLPEASELVLKLFKELKSLAKKDETGLMQPNFVAYAEVIVALLRSRKISHARDVLKLLRELQSMEDSWFWYNEKDGLTSNLLAKLKREIEASILPRKDKLLQELDLVKSIAAGASNAGAT